MKTAECGKGRVAAAPLAPFWLPHSDFRTAQKRKITEAW